MPQYVNGENTAQATENPVAAPHDTLTHLRPYAQSKYPVIGLSALFGVASMVPYTVFRRHAYIAPFFHRVGFTFALSGAAYAISSGDVRNGSGIATAWSLTYLFLHLRNSLKTPRNPLSLAMAGGAATCASLYGTEYFIFQA